jgi:hypothetical protein
VVSKDSKVRRRLAENREGKYGQSGIVGRWNKCPEGMETGYATSVLQSNNGTSCKTVAV